MSQLRVSGYGQPDFHLNVTTFDSPIYGEMNSAQVRSQVQYYPIKAYQPELVCEAVFPSEWLWEQWQSWVRQNMVNSQRSNSTGSPGVTLNWPERDINNWTGIISTAKAGGMRRNYTPRTRIEFQLVASLVSNLGVFASFGAAWQSVLGNNVVGANVDSVFRLPENFVGGATTPGNARTIRGGGAPAAALSNQVSPNNPLNLLGGLVPGVR